MATAKKELQEVIGQPPMSDYVFPNRARDYTPPPQASASIDLARMGKQAGLLGAGFLPGAGVADYFGQFPSMEGGTEPSAVENFQQGNYGTAALQGLGAMGDLAMTIPVAGMAVGSVLKAPRAAQKMLQELPKVDELGFYSQVEKAVMDNPQQKGTGAQFLAQIQKTPGVKAEELQYTGLDKFLADKPTVTKAEIQDYLDANKVQVQEVVLGGRTQKQRINDAFDEAGISPVSDVFAAADGRDSPEFYDMLNHRGLTADELPTALKNKLQEIEATPELSSSASPRFEAYTVPGGQNQREIYLTLPAKNPEFDPADLARLTELANKKRNAQEILQYRALASRYDASLRGETTPQYRVPQAHSASPEADVNRLAQLRVNDRVVDGKNTLFIEEIQSDWHQAGRKQGYGKTEEYAPGMEGQPEGFLGIKQGVPDAPFKTSWDELTLKRAIKLASDEGYDQIAFTTGKTQADRYRLSKAVNAIEVTGIRDDIRSVKISTPDNVDFRLKVNQDGVVQSAINGRDFVGKRLDEIIGKDMASEIMQADSGKSFTGLDLDVGGEGMKGFYDKMLPKKLEKLSKRYGAKVEKTTMDTPDGPVEIWAMQLPDELKETVSTQGQPLFQLGAGAVGTAGIMSLTGEDAQAAQEP